MTLRGLPLPATCSSEPSSGRIRRWKAKYRGTGLSELRKMRQLEEENRKLKQLVADLSRDKTMLQEILRKKA